ncbi:MAG: hypothetical protein AAF993_08760 [Pseudomonadota bacterium]
MTHVHALKELHTMGYEQIANRGLLALRKQIHLTDVSRLPEPLQAHESDELLDPRTPPFWARDRNDAHQIKLAHAVLSLMAQIPASTHQCTLNNMSKYWSLLP